MLLSESSNELEILTESTKTGKNMYIEGVFMVADEKNKNNRIYPKPVLEKAVDKYIKEYVSVGRALGQIEHPDYTEVNLEEAAMMITNLDWEGNKVIGKAKILNTPKGQILQGLLEAGYKAGVSSRGTGSVLTESGVSIVQDDFTLYAVDFVGNPSAPGAEPNTIYESQRFKKECINDLLQIIKNYK